MAVDSGLNTGLVAFDPVMKKFYDALRDAIDNSTTIYGFLPKKDSIDGKHITAALRIARSEGFGFQAAEADLPQAETAQWIELTIPPKYCYGTATFSQAVISQSRTDRGAFARAAKTAMQTLARDAADDMERVICGNGTGLLGVVANNVPVNTITLATPSDTRKFNFGMKLRAADNNSLDAFGNPDFGDGSTARDPVSGNYSVIQVIPNLGQVVLGHSNNIAIDDGLFRANSRNFPAGAGATSLGYEPIGMDAIIDDVAPPMTTTGGTLHGALRTGNPYFQSYVNRSAQGRPITEDLLQQLEDGANIRGGGKFAWYFMSYGVRSEYAQLQGNIRRTMNTAVIAGNTTGGFVEDVKSGNFIEYNNTPIIPGKYIISRGSGATQASSVYGVDPDGLYIGRVAPWSWMDDDGSIIKWVTNKPFYCAILYTYLETVGASPSYCAKATNVTGAEVIV